MPQICENAQCRWQRYVRLRLMRSAECQNCTMQLINLSVSASAIVQSPVVAARPVRHELGKSRAGRFGSEKSLHSAISCYTGQGMNLRPNPAEPLGSWEVGMPAEPNETTTNA